MDKKDISLILDKLSKEYQGDAAYPGRSSEGLAPEWPFDPFHVLISTVLSQRTKDDNTRKASDRLFTVYGTMEEIANADVEEISNLIRPAGFPNQKAKAIVEISNIILNEYDGKVPQKTEELLKLPLVGRKTAACVRAYAMGIPSVCVDTHVHRITNTMGLVNTNNPDKTEEELMRITPKNRWMDINRFFVRHGQTVCRPNRPDCDECVVADMCDSRKSVG